MALELLVQKIKTDTEREVHAIHEEAERQAQAIERETRNRTDELYRRESQALRARLSQKARQDYSQRAIEARRTLLREREALLDEARRRWEAWLADLPSHVEAALLRRLVERTGSLAAGGTIVAPSRCAEALGQASGLAVRADESAADGLRLVSADGRIAADLSYRVVAEDFWRRRRFDVAKRLLAEALEISPPRR